MDARYLFSMLCGLLLVGCSSSGNTELMERELRLQEDRIYYLEEELARCCEAMQCRDAELASLRSGRPSASPTTRSATSGPASSSPAELPKVELDLPEAPAPLNSLPSLFDPALPASDDAQGTAMRILKPQHVAQGERPAATRPEVPPTPRMRFATAVDGKPRTESSRVIMQWSAAPQDPAVAAPGQASPRTAALPRRPQWSPHR